jgi:hypothetical protein
MPQHLMAVSIFHDHDIMNKRARGVPLPLGDSFPVPLYFVTFYISCAALSSMYCSLNICEFPATLDTIGAKSRAQKKVAKHADDATHMNCVRVVLFLLRR